MDEMILTTEEREILIKLINKKGIENQLRQCVEEANEWGVSILHSLRGRDGHIGETITETADLIIMINQFLIMCPKLKEYVRKEINRKILRCEESYLKE